MERVGARFLDWHFGIHTRGYFRLQEVGIQDSDAEIYAPSSYTASWRLLRKARFVPHQDAFLDYGCGLGRVLVLASRYPYAQVIGVEFSEKLCRQAEQNLTAAGSRRRCGSVSVVNANAREFPVPDNVTVFFLFNPFGGETLRQVIRNVAESRQRNPRPVQLLVCNCSNLIELTGSASWLTRTYLAHSGFNSLCVFNSK